MPIAVPIEWLFSLLGLMLVGILIWIWYHFRDQRDSNIRNDADHTKLFIGHAKIDAKVDRTELKIDHIIEHHQPKMPPFNGGNK